MMRATALFASVAFAAADEWRALVVGDWGGASKSPYVVSVLLPNLALAPTLSLRATALPFLFLL